MTPDRESRTIWVALGALIVLVLAVAAALVLGAGGAKAVTISTSTTYNDKTLDWTEDVEVTSGAKLTIRSCDVTFRPSGAAPLELLVSHGSLEVYDSDLAGQGAGFVIRSCGPLLLRNVTASGLGAIANSTLGALGLPLAAHGGIMAFGTTLKVYNLDISSAPATALYAEDCSVDVFSLGVRDACSAYTAAGQCAGVALVWTGAPGSGVMPRGAVLNSSKLQTSMNAGLLIAASGTDLMPTVELKAVEISSSAADALVVVERGAHGLLRVLGDTNELNHNKGAAISWTRSMTSGDAELLLSTTRIYSNQGPSLKVGSSGSSGACDLVLDGCTIEENVGHGAIVTASGCTQSLNVTLRDCVVRKATGCGISFTADNDGQTSQYTMKLERTLVDSPTSHGVNARLTQGYADLNVTVDGSTISRAGGDGVHVEYDLAYWSWTSAPSAVGNLSVVGSTIADSKGYAVYDSRMLRSYYQWAQARATLTAFLNLVGSEFVNHTRTAVYVLNPSQLQYASYASEVVVDGCEFVNASGTGLYDRVDSLSPLNGGNTAVAWYVSDSRFERLTGAGVAVELRRADGAALVLDVRDCSFELIGDSAVTLSGTGAMQGNTVATFDGCTFKDVAKYAIYLSPGKPDATTDTHELHLLEVSIGNTTGVYASFDGVAPVDKYALEVVGFEATDTRGDALKVLLHPYTSAEAGTVLRDVLAQGTNGTAVHVALTSDRLQPLWGDIEGDNITLLDQVGALFLQDHTGRVGNLTIRRSKDSDLHKADLCVPGDRSGILELHDAILDRNKATVAGMGSLWVYNSLVVRVDWQNGRSALGAGVQVLDRTFSVVAVGHVDTEAGMRPVELLAYVKDKLEFRSRSPIIVNITFLDLEQTAVCSLDEPTTVVITLYDRVAPSAVILEPDDGSAQRAPRFEVRGSAFDAHAGILEIRCRLDGGNWTTIGDSSPFRAEVDGVQPGDHVLDVEVEDRAGNVAREVVHIEIDNQPPALTVTEPASDVVVRSSPITVMGETEDGATVSINGVNVTSTRGLFMAVVHLEEGPNTVTVVAMDRLSNVATIRFMATLDTVEPFLDVQSHEDGDWVRTSPQVLRGIVEAGCTLTVNGLSVLVTNQSFEAPVSLVEGLNTATLTATDPAGNVASLTLRLRLATAVPWVNLEEPADGAVLAQRELHVLGTAQDGCSVLLNGRPVTIKHGLIDELLILPEGASTVTVEARDGAGNLAVVTRSVFVDTLPPTITLDPLPRTTRDGRINVTGRTEGASVLMLGDVQVPLGANGSFTVEVALLEGTNALRLRAIDAAAHEATASAEVVLDTTSPFLRVLAPALVEAGDGTYVCSEQALLLQVVSEPGARVTALGVYLILGSEGTATIEVRLAKGAMTTVEIVSEDDLGNSASVRYDIRLAPGSDGGAAIDARELLVPVLYIAVVVCMFALVVRFRSLMLKATRGNGRRPHNGNGRTNGGGAR